MSRRRDIAWFQVMASTSGPGNLLFALSITSCTGQGQIHRSREMACNSSESVIFLNRSGCLRPFLRGILPDSVRTCVLLSLRAACGHFRGRGRTGFAQPGLCAVMIGGSSQVRFTSQCSDIGASHHAADMQASRHQGSGSFFEDREGAAGPEQITSKRPPAVSVGQRKARIHKALQLLDAKLGDRPPLGDRVDEAACKIRRRN